MREKGRDRDQISKLANCQHGHVTRQQLLAIGLGPRAIKHRLGAGDLIAVHAGVYAVGHVPRHAIQRAAAAVLACGDEAALSFAASLALWDLGEWPLTMEVTAPGSIGDLESAVIAVVRCLDVICAVATASGQRPHPARSPIWRRRSPTRSSYA